MKNASILSSHAVAQRGSSRSFRLAHPTSFMARGFTLIELLVVISIIAILAAILFPVFAQARERARTVSCMSNVAQIGLALHLYAQDHEGRFPPDEKTWNTAVMEYVKNTQIFRCPSAAGPADVEFNYAYQAGHTADEPGFTLLLFDAPDGSEQPDQGGGLFRHMGSANVFLLNGKVKSVQREAWLKAGWPLPEPPRPAAGARGGLPGMSGGMGGGMSAGPPPPAN